MVRQNLVGYRTAWRGTAAGLVVGVVLALVSWLGLLTGPYTALQDSLFPAPAPNSEITLVAADQSSEEAFLGANGAFPWSNKFHATVIDNLVKLRPRLLVIDLVFNHATGFECLAEQFDATTVEGVNKCQKAGQYINTDTLLVDALEGARKAGIPVIIACTADDHPLPIFSDAVTAPKPGYAPGFVADSGLGFPDAAGLIRSVPLQPAKSCIANPSRQPMFWRAISVLEGHNSPSRIEPGSATIGNRRVPLTPAGEMLINFSTGTSPTCSYLAAFDGACPQPSKVTGHVVVVGLKILGAGDVHSQPVAFRHDASFCGVAIPMHCMNDNQNYGYRILGDEIGTVLGNRFVRLQPGLSVLLAILVIAALTGTVAYLLPLRVGFLAMLLGVAAYIAGAIAFGQAGYLVDPLFAPAAIVLASALALAARYLIEERERRKLEEIFGQYVDPNVMNELVALESAEQLTVGGERRELSVLFVDVRGFTTASEKMDAVEVVAALNEFTERCRAIVFEYGGTVDKYIGDCVMAFWNAPQKRPDHADRAVAAALRMLASQPASGPLRAVGIGICTGEVVIGNVGGPTRKQYTAIGDVVNTASRLCAAAPAGALLLAGATYTRLSVKPAADRLEPLQVKGKSEPVPVYSITWSAPVPA
jgi:class 3 adenylate cyclase/CHASE2 domain-containing sensor protein